MSKLFAGIATATTAILIITHLLGSRYEHQAHKLLFKAWMIKNGRSYPDQEYTYRLAKFQHNAELVREHNARYALGLESYNLELNQFADMDSTEFAAKYLMKTSSFEKTGNCSGKTPSSQSIPTEVDWSTKGAVTPIKNQGQCGSCWAFSTTGSVEGAKFIKDGLLESYSEQQLVDCSRDYGNQGCNGGLMDQAFWYIIDNGISLESKYPYKGIDQKCTYSATEKAFSLSNCADVPVDKEQALLAAIAQQPVSVAIEANHASFQLYKSGVYNGLCGTQLDHGVLAVGYGTDSGKDFYKVKNSWGSGWGDNGYIRIIRNGDGKGKCGIQMAASIPVA